MIKSITYNISGGKDYIHHGQEIGIVGIIFTYYFFKKLLHWSRKGKEGIKGSIHYHFMVALPTTKKIQLMQWGCLYNSYMDA